MHSLWLPMMFVLAGVIPAQVVAENPEPNDLSGTPTLLPVGACGEGVLTGGDVDYWIVPMPAPGVLTAWTNRGVGGTATVDTILEVRDVMDALLADNDDGSACSTGSELRVALPAGVHYLVVRGFTPTTAGGYNVHWLTDFLVVAETPESAEPNGDPGGGGVPTVAPLDALCRGTITAGDADWYAISIGAPTAISALVMPGGNQGTNQFFTDPLLDILDSAGGTVATDDDSGPCSASLLNVTLQPGNYHVVVRGFSNTVVGEYVLRLSVSSTAVIGKFDPAPAGSTGCAGSAGTPLLTNRSAVSGSMPVLGSTFCLDVRNLPIGAVTIRLLGFSPLPTPFDLGPLGAPTCFIRATPVSTDLAVAGAGTDLWTLVLPPNPLFLSLPLAAQVAVFDPAANTLGLSVSNLATGVVGNIRSWSGAD